MITIRIENTDSENPVILRLMRLDDGKELDCISEAQLLPRQVTDVDVGFEQSLVVFQR